MSSGKPKYPLGTIAAYGPTDRRATKLVAAIFPRKQKEPNALRKWTTANADIREDASVQEQLSSFLKEHHVAQAIVAEEIMGCPHEEGIDYPAGEACPECPFWAHRPRLKAAGQNGSKVKRNDPCPCGSGNKYKKCCGVSFTRTYSNKTAATPKSHSP